MTIEHRIAARIAVTAFSTLCALLWGQCSVFAQTPAPATSVEKNDPTTKVYRFPMLLLADFEPNAGNDPVIRCNIAGRSYWFSVDTGLDFNLIKQSVQKETQIEYTTIDLSETKGVEDAFTIGGKVQEAKPKIDMGEFVVPGGSFLVCEDDKIGELLVKQDRTVAGILGAPFFRSRAVVFDYDQREMRMRPRGKLSPEAVREMGFGDSDAVLDLKNITPNTLTVATDVLCNGKKVSLIVDTGGASSLLAISPKELGLDASKLESGFFRMFQGEGTTKKAKITMVVAGLKQENVPVSFFADARKREGIGSGALGRDFLMRFNFLIDFPGKKMYLKHRRNLERDTK